MLLPKNMLRRQEIDRSECRRGSMGSSQKSVNFILMILLIKITKKCLFFQILANVIAAKA